MAGFGQDGNVFLSPAGTAVKVLETYDQFDRELACFERLAEHGVTLLASRFEVPVLLGSERDIRVIEMTLVRPPFLLDFAGCSLDEPRIEDEHLIEHWEKLEEMWGERFGVVQELYNELILKHGIYYYDFHKGNLKFEGE